MQDTSLLFPELVGDGTCGSDTASPTPRRSAAPPESIGAAVRNVADGTLLSALVTALLLVL